MRDTFEIRVRGCRIRIRYTRPSFLEGMARIFDWSGALDQRDTHTIETLRAQYDTDKTGFEADAEEIREVWAEVGQYLYDAMGRYDQEARQSGAKCAEDKE